MTIRKVKDTRWGLSAIAPEDAFAIWGARTILGDNIEANWCPARPEAGSFSIVRDRQDIHGITADDCKDLAMALNVGILEECQRSVARLLRTGEMRADQQHLFELYDDRYFRVVADTRASFGYLYLVAWLKNPKSTLKPWWARTAREYTLARDTR